MRRGARGSAVVWGAGFWLGGLVLAALVLPTLLQMDPNRVALSDRLLPPIGFGGTWEHPLGTDTLGRDLLARVLVATRISLAFALIGTVLGAVIGTLVGFSAAHFGGWWESLVLAAVDLQAAIPFFVVALALIAVFGAGLGVLLLVVSVYGWERYARLARATALSAKSGSVVQMAAGYGAPPWRIYSRHILPGAMGVLLVNATLNFPETLLLESTLSFLGLGVQPPDASLGTIMSYGRDHLINAWWIAVVPGIVVTVTTMLAALAADAIGEGRKSPF